MPSWIHVVDGEPSWRQRFDGMKDLIASLGEEAEGVDSTGQFEEVLEVRKMLHQGRRSSERESRAWGIQSRAPLTTVFSQFLQQTTI
jgi:hypothetical protein